MAIGNIQIYNAQERIRTAVFECYLRKRCTCKVGYYNFIDFANLDFS
jgi:hypothetical protein